jgi:hypothetical protein
MTDGDVPHENSLPLVTIRDPYQWMQSMCRHEYAAHWHHTPENCPNIVKRGYHDTKEHGTLALDSSDLVAVDIHYSENFHVHHNSLPHFWNDWYQLYFNATYPRIMVRFEDLLFYGQEVTETLCACGGGVTRQDRKANHFVHISKSAKKGTAAHGSHKTDLVAALIKYGNDVHRLDNLTPEDLKATRQVLDSQLMQAFGYSNPAI